MVHVDAPTAAPATRSITTTVLVARVGIAYFAFAIVVLHFLRPDYDPVLLTTSVYAVGQYGYVMSAAFVAVSVATLAVVIGLRPPPSSPSSTVRD